MGLSDTDRLQFVIEQFKDCVFVNEKCVRTAVIDAHADQEYIIIVIAEDSGGHFNCWAGIGDVGDVKLGARCQ